jgi:hypothetical protein
LIPYGTRAKGLALVDAQPIDDCLRLFYCRP